MDLRNSIIKMLKRLLEDMQVVQQQGAGYYSCISVAKRYNKLLDLSCTLFPEGDGLIGSFDKAPESDPKDPGDKMKLMQDMRIEIAQLISLLESSKETDQP